MAATTGRKPKYKTPEEMQAVIDQYFIDCEGELWKNEKGEPKVNKFGDPIYLNQRPPTITGLALALGFTNRQALLTYQAKQAFTDTVTRAKARVEAYTEGRLFDRDGTRGAEFSLRCNFKWAGNEPSNSNGILPDILRYLRDEENI